jgi:hypothetical protein
MLLEIKQPPVLSSGMYLLRIINKNRWRLDDPAYARQSPSDAPAHTLLDLPARGNELSLWLVDDSITRLPRLLTALAANRDRIEALDYVLFRMVILDQVGIKHQSSPGDSPDPEANKWHLALLDLTARQVATLAVSIWHSPLTKVERQSAQVLKRWMFEALDNAHFELNNLKETMRQEVAQKR